MAMQLVDIVRQALQLPDYVDKQLAVRTLLEQWADNPGLQHMLGSDGRGSFTVMVQPLVAEYLDALGYEDQAEPPPWSDTDRAQQVAELCETLNGVLLVDLLREEPRQRVRSEWLWTLLYCPLIMLGLFGLITGVLLGLSGAPLPRFQVPLEPTSAVFFGSIGAVCFATLMGVLKTALYCKPFLRGWAVRVQEDARFLDETIEWALARTTE